MRVQLKLQLECTPDAAWDAIRSPRVLRELLAPVISIEPESETGFPLYWDEGEHPVTLHALYGIIPLGEQMIDIRYSERGDVRILEDAGGAISGPLVLARQWRHRMAVAPHPKGGTLYRDRLDFRPGIAAPAVWPALWAAWQGRAARIRQISGGWGTTNGPLE